MVKFIFYVVKGKYFRNFLLLLDIEIDGLNFLFVNIQWFWKDDIGKWNLYCREMNVKFNKCYKCNFKLIVVVNV